MSPEFAEVVGFTGLAEVVELTGFDEFAGFVWAELSTDVAVS